MYKRCRTLAQLEGHHGLPHTLSAVTAQYDQTTTSGWLIAGSYRDPHSSRCTSVSYETLVALYRSNHSHTALSKQRNATELPPRDNQSLGLYRRPSQLALNWPATRILAVLYRSGHELQLNLCGLTVVDHNH